LKKLIGLEIFKHGLIIIIFLNFWTDKGH